MLDIHALVDAELKNAVREYKPEVKA